MNKPIACLISCVSKKQKRPDRAIALYTSDLFKKSVLFAQSKGLPVFILSAKYGLLNSDRVIAPYDETLNKKTTQDLDAWAKRAAKAIELEFGEQTLLVLAGSKYLSFVKYTNNRIVDPLKGLGIGRRLQSLKQNTK